jgi:hypothetical protein
MIKYIKKLFQEGIQQAKEEGILPRSFNKRVIPLGKQKEFYFFYSFY